MILKHIYDAFYNISTTLGIESNKDLFAILYIVLFVILIIFLIKTSIQFFKLVNETKKTRRKIYKIFIETLKDHTL